ncbi:DUF309 domain-containing protein [Bacillus sp. V5-8f]|uniref:DUF309 domain-containing protein n=1 Tax=Bacillus sp. V5-8f TaxID=2053044 RepID=UPI000C762AC7|nr:DUF309 domain-containing protein [Bacillus sp. V5-8f]PLT34818.1 DUF309 domain-containing protein [Bacillus sp. V5-8f]
MNYPGPYLLYLVHFHGDRDYFECHEVLEEYWKEAAPGERESHWVGLIQVAVSFYHYRRRNVKGALKTMKKAVSILEKKPTEIMNLGMNHKDMLILLFETIDRMNIKADYESIDLPLIEPALIETCKKMCVERRIPWRSKSDLANTQLVNRHSLRDRSDVIQEREHQLSIRHRGNARKT